MVPGPIYRTQKDATGKVYVAEERTVTSSSSPRVKGKLVLQAQPYQKYHMRRTVGSQTYSGNGWFYPVYDGRLFEQPPSVDSLNNHLRSKFANRVRGSAASAGVTLASWKQSRELIVKRSSTGLNLLKGLAQRKMQILQTGRKGRRERLENFYLECKFGLVPLIEDVAASMAVMQDPEPRSWVSSTVENSGAFSYHKAIGRETNSQNGSWRIRSTLSCACRVSHNNAWIGNRLGLLNLPGVAWDLVPWSFVVNMFVNVNQLVGSVSEFVGIDMSNLSRTDLTVTSCTISQTGAYQNSSFATSTIFDEVAVRRTLGSQAIPPYAVAVRVPDLNWGLAATAFALVTQKVRSL